MTKALNSEVFDKHRDRYVETLKPLFLPNDPCSNDIVRYFSALLRVLGCEDKGWDPYAESRAVLNDINSLFKLKLPQKLFPDETKTTWRLGLILYSHIVEMDAPYEVITNLLRFQSGDGYSPNPYFKFLSASEQKRYKKSGISTRRKIGIIKELSEKNELNVGAIFDEFYNNNLRNSISHSDYILDDECFKCRGGLSGLRAFKIKYDELDEILV